MTVQYSIQKMVSDGTLSTIALGIQYLQRNDIYVRIAGVDTPQSGAPSGYTWSFIDSTTLKILPVVPNGIEVVVYRRTDVDAMYNVYSQNAQFDEATIDENNQQLLYIAQEYLEQGSPGTGIDTIEYTCLVNMKGTGATHETVVTQLPASIAKNSRYVLSNPFGAHTPVECWAEVFFNGVWSRTGFISSSIDSSDGTEASYVQGVGIVIQTGASSVVTQSVRTGGGHGTNTSTANAPCRVFVRKLEA